MSNEAQVHGQILDRAKEANYQIVLPDTTSPSVHIDIEKPHHNCAIFTQNGHRSVVSSDSTAVCCLADTESRRKGFRWPKGFHIDFISMAWFFFIIRLNNTMTSISTVASDKLFGHAQGMNAHESTYRRLAGTMMQWHIRHNDGSICTRFYYCFSFVRGASCSNPFRTHWYKMNLLGRLSVIGERCESVPEQTHALIYGAFFIILSSSSSTLFVSSGRR